MYSVQMEYDVHMENGFAWIISSLGHSNELLYPFRITFASLLHSSWDSSSLKVVSAVRYSLKAVGGWSAQVSEMDRRTLSSCC